VKATSAICTFGNLGDKVLRKDISKISLGFIPDLSNISKDNLVKHLVCKCLNFTRSSANKAITNFIKYVEK